MTIARVQARSVSSVLPNRNRYLLGFAILLAAGLVLDPSIYVGRLTHVYVHDVTSAVVFVLGVMVMVRTRSEVLPRALYVPAGLLIFLAVDTIVSGAINYAAAPVLMHKLFWFEHLDALRIVGELFAWVWAFGQLQPSEEDGWQMFDIAIWGAAAGVALIGAWDLVTNSRHFETGPFDQTVMVGLPMSMVFALRRMRHADLVRLGVFGAGSLLLYSRAAMVIVAFALVVVLLAARDWRKFARNLTPVLVGGLLVIVVGPYLAISPELRPPAAAQQPVPYTSPGQTLHASPSPEPQVAGSAGLARQTVNRFLSIGASQLVPYTIPSRLAIWKDAARIFASEPAFGVGYHDYFLYSHVSEIKNGTANSPPDLPGGLIKQAHNEVLCMLAETGLIGTAIFLGFWFLTLRGAYRLWRVGTGDRIRYAFTAGFLFSLFGVSFVGEILIPRTPNWLATSVVWWIMISFVYIQMRGRSNASSLPEESH